MTDFVTDKQRQKQWEDEHEAIGQSGTDDSASESECECESESEANAVVNNHYHEKGGHGMYGYNYGCGIPAVMPVTTGGCCGGGHGNCGGYGSEWLAMMFPFMMMGMWNRGGMWGGDGFDRRGGFGGFDGGSYGVAGVEGRLHNDMAIQTLNQNLHDNALQACNNTSAITANADRNAFGIQADLNNGFRGLEACCCDTKSKVLETGYMLRSGNDANAFAIQRGMDQNTWSTNSEIGRIGAQLADCCCQTQRAIDQSTYATSRQLCDMQHAADKCCCETNLNIERQGHANQITALQNTQLLERQHCDLLNAINDVKCTVVNQAKDTQMAAMADEISRMRAHEIEGRTIGTLAEMISGVKKEVGCCCCGVNNQLNQLGSQLASQFNPTFIWPPSFGAQCCC